MALPKQINFNLSRDEYRNVYNMCDGHKAKKTRNWIIAVLILFALACMVFIAVQYGSACQYVNGVLDYSTYSADRLNKSAVITAILLLVATGATGVLMLYLHHKQNEMLFDIYYNRYHEGVIVMGNESFLYRSGDKKFEINLRYGDLYEAHEIEDYFLLITYDDDQIPVDKRIMDRDTFSRISMLLTQELGVYFFKMGRSNFDLNEHILIRTTDERAAIKKLGR